MSRIPTVTVWVAGLAKINDFDDERLADKDVLWFEVVVSDSLLDVVLHSQAYLVDEVEFRSETESVVMLYEELVERGVIVVLHEQQIGLVAYPLYGQVVFGDEGATLVCWDHTSIELGDEFSAN
jgi:hypothetical protein